MKPMRYLLLLLLCVGILAACSHADEGHDAHEAHAEAGPDEQPSNHIDIPTTVRRNLGITFVPVERRQVASTMRIPGSFELEPLARHEYRMLLSGEVALQVDQYQRVELGDVLYRFRSPQWPELQHEIIMGEQEIVTANAQIAVAESKMVEVQTKLTQLRERLSALDQAQVRRADLEAQAAELEAVLKRQEAELELAKTGLINARSTREHALHRAASASGIEEAQLSRLVEQDGEQVPAYRTIEWITVRATRPGVVEKLALTDGSFAQAPELVLSTIDLTRVRFHAEALQADLPRLSKLTRARIIAPGDARALEQALTAEVSIGLEANPQQRTVALIATPSEHQDWARPGVSAFLEAVVESTDEPALAIPQAAVVKDGIVHVFFLRDPDDPNKAIRVEADLGISDGKWVVVNSGVSLGDEVVLDGAYELKLASQQSGGQQKGGHFHADGTFHPTDEH